MTSNNATDSKKPGEIYAIALIKRGIADGHARSMSAALKALRASEFGGDAIAYTNEILKPFFLAVAERSWLLKPGTDLKRFCDEFDFWKALDEANQFAKRRRREGVIGVSHYDIAASRIGEGLDEMFPQRPLLSGRAA